MWSRYLTVTACLLAVVSSSWADDFWDGSLDLANLDGANGFVLNGIDETDRSGYSVSGAGDVNGDGIADVIIGAYTASPGGDIFAGESYVVFGSDGGFGASMDLSSLNGTNGFVINGIDVLDRSGHSVSGAGDVNGDGIADVIIGAYGASPGGANEAGESYVVFGSGGSFGASLDLSSLGGTNGFVINGIDASDYSGHSVSAAGDVNGDGIADVIIGAYYADPGGDSQAGESYVVFGSGGGFAASLDLSSLGGTNGFVLNGIDASDYSGWSVSAAGDVNGDGIADVIIGAYEADPGGFGGAGESYVVFGSAGGFGASMDLSSLNGTNGFVINGIDFDDFSGISVSGAGDINGDGIADVIIGAYGADPGGDGLAGESYVVFGSGGGFAASLDLSSLGGTNGFVINGIDADDWSGWSVSGAGDVNGDGIADLIIGAYGADPGGVNVAGESYVVFGEAGFTWTSLGGGDFESNSNWLGGKAPATTGGVVIIRPDYGGTVNGPAGNVFVDSLTLDAEAGVGTLDLPASGLLVVDDWAKINAGGRLTGDGTFAVEGNLTNEGEIDLGTGSLQVLAGTLSNTGLLRGVGRVDAPVDNTGQIEAIDQPGELVFEQLVTNQPDGLIAMRASAVRFNAGLTNTGRLLVSVGDSDIFGDIDNTGTIGIAGAGQVSLVGGMTQNGELDILQDARLVVFEDFGGTGGFTGGGTLEVLGTMSGGSSTAVVELGGDLVLGSSCQTIMELASETDFDQLNATGSVALAGELNVVGYEGYRPREGNAFAVITAQTGFAGDFAEVTSNITLGLPGGMAAFAGGIDGTSYEVIFNGFTAGDANADHKVSIGDLSIMAANWNQTGFTNGYADADFNGDGNVSIGDLSLMAANWDWQLPGSSAIPEPATLSLLALGGLAVVRRKR